jgi:predicted ATPase
MRAATQLESFWSDTYRGRKIAILNHGGRWLVYLDHVLQHRMLFETAEAAVNWLQRKVDLPTQRRRMH